MNAEKLMRAILGENLQTASFRVVVVGVLISFLGGLVLWLI